MHPFLWAVGVSFQDPGLEQAKKCGRVKPVNGIPTFLPCILDLQEPNKNTSKHAILKKNFTRSFS